MSYHSEVNMRRHIMRASQFDIQKNVQGQVTSETDKIGLQGFYNAFATVFGFAIAWGGIGLATYFAVKSFLGV